MARADKTDTQDAGASESAAATRIDAAPGATAGEASSLLETVLADAGVVAEGGILGVEKITQELRAWAYEHLSGGPIARNTECWNHLHDVALPALANHLAQKEG